jgi:hypothetical protein
LRLLRHPALDGACQAALSGPYRCSPEKPPDRILWLVRPLSARALLELHDQDRARSWTNLLALTRLVVQWRPQRFNLCYSWFYTQREQGLRAAFGATWQALQAGAWSDHQLAALQREWESADVRSGLPEMAARARASVAAAFRSLPPRDSSFAGPADAWGWLTDGLGDLRYRARGKYEDEELLLRVLCDCERDFRRAEACSTWKQITALPGIQSWTPAASNLVASVPWWAPKPRERFNLLWGVREVCGFAFDAPLAGPPAPFSQLGLVAGWESRRRLLLTAIALERFRVRRGAYPESLDLLIPELLSSVPLDFMDGQPLRYRRTEDGHFLLYSIGVDCIDDGGNDRASGSSTPLKPGGPWLRPPFEAPDIIWPRPASPAEVSQEAAARRLARSTNEKATFVP